MGFPKAQRLLLTFKLNMVLIKSTLVTFKAEGLAINLFYGEGVELLVEGVRSSTVNSEIFARVVLESCVVSLSKTH